MNCKIVVLYFSKNGSTQSIAKHIARGIKSVEGCEAMLRTVDGLNKDTVPQDPIITVEELKHSDGLAMGSPVWFGNMAAPLKHFWDQTSSLWIAGSLIDKPACVFTSSSSMHGGHETTLQTMMLPLLHHGMMIMGIPYSEPRLHSTQSGGTPYGATALSTTSPSLSDDEAFLSKQLGKRLAVTSLKMKRH